MRQPASYHGGLGLSLLGQRVRPAPPPRRGVPLLHEPIFISPTTTRTSSVLPQPSRNTRHQACTQPTQDSADKASRQHLPLKINTIGEDIDNLEAVGKQLMKIREADTVQQLQRLLRASALCAPLDHEVVRSKSKAQRDSDDDLDAVADVYETYFLVHHTTLRDAIARVGDSEAVT